MTNSQIKFQYRTLYESLSKLFTSRDKKFFAIMVCAQIFLGFLDLLSVILIGVIGSLAVSGISSAKPGNRITRILDYFNISNLSLQAQASILGIAAASLLISKTLISVYFTRRSLRFISLRSAQISARLLRKVLSQDLKQLKAHSFQKTLYSVTSGVDVLAVGIVGTVVVMLSDVSLTSIMIIGLFSLDKLIAAATFAFFGIVGFTLHRLLAGRAQRIAKLQTDFGIKSTQRILEVLGAYREIFVKNRREYYADSIGRDRQKLAEIGAEKAFLPNISKYVFEITTVLGAFLIAALQFLRTDALHAVTVLTVFLAASARISPALLRIQQGLLTLRSSAVSALPSLELIELTVAQEEQTDFRMSLERSEFKATIEINDISFQYEPTEDFALREINLRVAPGEIIALVGPSGSGKSTLVDLLLGLLRPTKGSILISGKLPLDCIREYPGMIAYVPQETAIFEGTIRENVALGFDVEDFSSDQIHKAINLASLSQFVDQSAQGLDTMVGERGTRLSGGQRQRLGIARALLTEPKLLILDEATSSLDGKTEHEISEAIISLKGKTTVIIIAHRLSTVKNADKIIYIENGTIKAQGNFDELRNLISDFDHQAKLMGL